MIVVQSSIVEQWSTVRFLVGIWACLKDTWVYEGIK